MSNFTIIARYNRGDEDQILTNNEKRSRIDTINKNIVHFSLIIKMEVIKLCLASEVAFLKSIPVLFSLLLELKDITLDSSLNVAQSIVKLKRLSTKYFKQRNSI